MMENQPITPLQLAERQLADRKILHEKMKAVNRIIETKLNPLNDIVALGYEPAHAEELVKKKGYSSDDIQTNLLQVGRLTIRISDLRANEA